jgi:hypothetical protein
MTTPAPPGQPYPPPATTGPPDAAVTARAFLLGNRVPDVAPVRAEGLGRLTRAAGDSLRGQVGTVLAGMLELDLADLLLAGWRRYGALQDAARSTATAPGSSAVVDLATHRVTATYAPRVDVVLDGLPVAHVDAALRVDFDVVAVAATVRAGHLVDLRGGRCTVTADLSVEGVPVARRQATADAAVVVPLGAGLPLLDEDRPGEVRLPQQAADTVVLPQSPAAGRSG